MKYPATFALILLLATPLAAAERTGALHGTIVSRDVAKNALLVDHQEVPGLMSAMAMPYEVRGARVASLPKDGAAITAVLHELNGSYWLTDVKPARAEAHDMSSMKGMQHDSQMQHEMPGMKHDNSTRQHDMSATQHDMRAMHDAASPDPTADLLMRQASGTSMNPAAAPMHMSMTRMGDWMVMLHGLAFVNQVMQTGPRGGDKLFSTNWVMGMADRSVGGGHLMLRSMLSLEPITVGKKYPELFQTGETIGGEPIIDAQHPHDFFMELAAEYAHPIDANTIAYIYAAPMGDPSLGPVAYPHRASAAEIPQAALSHHVQDSTHIAASVVTIGAQRGAFGAAFSGFRGREPDEQRWDIESGGIDSWAARLTFDPAPEWSAQISTGHLRHPEAAEPGNVQRTTASVAYSRALMSGHWDASLVFGHNDKSEGRNTSAWLAETTLRFLERNYLSARAEIVDKDELFHKEINLSPPVTGAVFRVKAFTVGYTRDLVSWRSISGAAGANVTTYAIPTALKPYYGNPHSVYLFVRLRGGLL